MEELILLCLNKDPAQRPQSVAEVSSALADCKDAGKWDKEAANRWWQEHGKQLREKARAFGEAARGHAESVRFQMPKSE